MHDGSGDARKSEQAPRAQLLSAELKLTTSSSWHFGLKLLDRAMTGQEPNCFGGVVTLGLIQCRGISVYAGGLDRYELGSAAPVLTAPKSCPETLQALEPCTASAGLQVEFPGHLGHKRGPGPEATGRPSWDLKWF